MPDLLILPPPNAVDDAWLTVLDGRLAREIQRAGPGQCLRLEGLARHLLEALAERAGGAGTAEVYLIDHQQGPESWRVGVHRVVARRNAGELVVVALIGVARSVWISVHPSSSWNGPSMPTTSASRCS